LLFLDFSFCFLVEVGFLAHLKLCKPPFEDILYHHYFGENKTVNLRFISNPFRS
jgi:hypothetical protein